jgi:hypothetical protein
MPLLAVVVSVAVVGGMSTTLAGTISLNSSGSVEFGQGVVTTAACDTSIKIIPASTFAPETSTFSVSSITLANIGISGDTATVGGGCLGKKLTLKAYNAAGTALRFNPGSGAEITEVFVTIPATAVLAESGNNYSGNTKSSFAGVEDAATFAGKTTSDIPAGTFKITGLAVPGSVTRITLESSEA